MGLRRGRHQPMGRIKFEKVKVMPSLPSLPEIENRLVDLHGSINLRPTIDRAASIGELLGEAKAQLPHGEWIPWLRKVGIHRNSANDYMAVCRLLESNDRPPGHLTIKGFLAYCRRARKTQMRALHQEERDKLAAEIGHRKGIKIVHVDCRRHRWPLDIDIIATDPPWDDIDAYRWLGKLAAEHLRTGGLLMAQASPGKLPDVLAALGAHLSYVWTFAFVFSEHTGKWANLKPVVVYAKGKVNLPWCADTFISGQATKALHEWQQPTEPWRYWLSKLTTPGQLIADPFAGSGTIGVVCSELHLKFIGTEIDAEKFKIARGRLA